MTLTLTVSLSYKQCNQKPYILCNSTVDIPGTRSCTTVMVMAVNQLTQRIYINAEKYNA